MAQLGELRTEDLTAPGSIPDLGMLSLRWEASGIAAAAFGEATVAGRCEAHCSAALLHVAATPLFPENRNRTRNHQIAAVVYGHLLYQLSYSGKRHSTGVSAHTPPGRC